MHLTTWRCAALVIATAVGLLSASVCAAQTPLPTEAVDAFLRRQMDQRAIPGMQVAVVKDGRVVFSRAYGVANLQTPVPVTDQTVFSINSATKPFTGVEVMRLVSEGKVDLAAPVSTYLHDLPVAWRGVTIRQLLSHMSGLPEVLPPGGYRGGEDEAAVFAIATAKPVDFAPGERFAYIQTNYLLLRRIIESIEGKDFQQVMADRYFQPLGMTGSGFGDSRDVIPNKADSYRFGVSAGTGQRVLQNVYEIFPPSDRAAAGMNNTAGDIARWLIALQSGRILDQASLTQLWTPVPFNDGRRGEWALGWITFDRPAHPAVGMTGGGRSAFFVYPEDGVAVIMLTNLAGASPEELVDQIAAFYIPGMQLTGVTALRAGVEERGFAALETIADELTARDPATPLGEGDLNSWGYRLMAAGRVDDALRVMKLIVELYPQSGNAFDSLAETWERTGDSQKAIETYRRALELDPGNANAAAQLARLETPAGS